MSQSSDPNEVLEDLKSDCPEVVIEGKTYWVVEGDLLFNQEELTKYALRRAASVQAKEQDSKENEKKGLLAMAEGGRMVRWAKDKVLIYRVDYDSFRGRVEEYSQVVAATNEAAHDWQSACDVKFHHVAEFDKFLPNGAELPLFDVSRNWESGNLLALAFFPSYPVERRHVYVYNGFFNQTANPYGQIGVMRHELGHVLGFRHEHIRAEAPISCKQGRLRENTSGVVELTTYDHKSVMHYICPNMKIPPEADWVLTEYDRRGAQVLYGTPDGKNPPPDDMMKYYPREG